MLNFIAKLFVTAALAPFLIFVFILSLAFIGGCVEGMGR